MRRYVLYVLFFLITGFALSQLNSSGAVFVNIIDSCPVWVSWAAWISALSGALIGVIVLLRGYAPIWSLLSIITMFIAATIVSMFLVPAGESFARSIGMCPKCNVLADVQDYRKQGNLEAAEQSVDNALNQYKEGNSGNGTGKLLVRGCQADLEIEKSYVHLDKANKISDGIGKLKPENENDYSMCDTLIADARSNIAEALKYAELHRDDDRVISGLIPLIKKSQENLDLKSKLCIPPVKDARITFEPDDQQVKGDVASVHIKMFTDGEKTTGAANLLEIRQMDNTVVPVDVKEIVASTPLCMLFLADNSGSLIDSTQNPAGIEPVREAVRTLNAVRKEGDYVGMVTFGSQVDVSTAQPLGFDPLNTDLINGRSGNTAIWDAFDYGLKRMTDECKVDKRYLILMTDGLDTASEYLKNVEYQAADGDTEIEKQLKQLEATVTQMRERAMAANIDVFIIAVGSGGKDPDQKAAFKKLASEQRYYEVGFAGLAQQLKDIFGYQEDHYFVEFDAKYLGTDQKIKVGLKTGNTEVIIDFSKP